MKKKIGVLVLGAALAFGMSTGAWAQGGGAGGGAGGAGGVLQVQVPVEIQLVVPLEGEVHLMPIAEFESLQPFEFGSATNGPSSAP